MGYSKAFEIAFEQYIAAAQQARDANQSEKQRQQLFLTFIQGGFGIQASEFELEKAIKLDNTSRHGYIDVLFGGVVIEFKRDISKAGTEKEHSQLRDYVIEQSRYDDYLGILTDGINFEVFALEEENSLRQIECFELRADDIDGAFLRLDSYLFSQGQITPTAADIVERFGEKSPTFHTAANRLGKLLARLEDNPALDLKRKLWRGLLAKVYGSDIGSDELFIRHTYLNQFAKLLAYAVLAGQTGDMQTLADIVTGEAFYRYGVNNLGEIDFFAWLLEDEIQEEALQLLRRLLVSLSIYDLNKINEDLLKELYQSLVPSETRHTLGEYYTPHWMAELILEEIDYQPGQSLLDPSCGSGTFLFHAIRQLADRGMSGWELVDFALENIAGMDVNPLAVTIARVTYLLAIRPHMSGKRGDSTLLPLPVYVADSLQTALDTGVHKDTLVIPVDVERDEQFLVPKDAASAPHLFTEVIERMEDFAQYPLEEINMGLRNDFLQLVRDYFSKVQRGIADVSTMYWSQNLGLLNKLIHENRNSIWGYMLKNAARPLLLTTQKFDVIVGNPPWLTYKDIKDKTYQAEVRDLILETYGLLDSGDRKLFTQMELATLFMVHCEAQYLKNGGTIAFVMPRSVITGAKHHRKFQARGLSRVLDFLEVKPRPFNIESCALIRNGEQHQELVPTLRYTGKLPQRELRMAEAKPHLATREGKTPLLGEVGVASPAYYDDFKQGATLVPRNLCFVKPLGQISGNPTMESDPALDKDAKKPWKGMRIEGLVYPENLYTTLLSKSLVPFGARRFHMVALPVRMIDSVLKPMEERDFLTAGHNNSWRTWFGPAEEKWDENKKDTSSFENLLERYDYQRTLTSQQPASGYKVLYNSSGVHLASCVVNAEDERVSQVYGVSTSGFVVDYKTYYFHTENPSEAHYLSAILNAPCVDEAIKPYQSRGKGVVGQRDVSRTPFEAVPIPAFDESDERHLELARLSQEAHEIVAGLKFTGGVVKARRLAREAISEQIKAIDAIAQEMLGI